MKKVAVSVLAFLSLAALIGFLVSAPGSDDESEEPSAAATAAGGETVAADRALEVPGLEPFAGVGAEEEAAPAPAPVGAASLGSLGAVPVLGAQIVKTAEVSVVVERDSFTEAFDSASLVASRYGGFVESSSIHGVKSRSGTLTIRIPASSFDLALKDLRSLGRVDRLSISGQDVSAQFVDLDARLRTWQAQEVVLLRLMNQANSVGATLQVQRELQDVQLRIEQITGQLRALEDRTDMSTIAVSLREAGVVATQAVQDGPSLGKAWDDAVDGFLAVVSAMVVGLGYLVPITVVLGAGWIAFRRLRPRIAS
jgi:hypothetical protein